MFNATKLLSKIIQNKVTNTRGLTSSADALALGQTSALNLFLLLFLFLLVSHLRLSIRMDETYEGWL